MPESNEFTFVDALKLGLGSVVFLALCVSLIFLVLPIGRLLEGDTSTGTFILWVIALVAMITLATLLYILGRKSKKEREEIERSPIARQFAKQKLRFQISSLVLIASTVLTIVITAPFAKSYPAIAYIVSASFFFGYWILGRVFWRCPGCGVRLSFMLRWSDHQSIENCPSCHVKLQ